MYIILFSWYTFKTTMAFQSEIHKKIYHKQCPWKKKVFDLSKNLQRSTNNYTCRSWDTVLNRMTLHQTLWWRWIWTSLTQVLKNVVRKLPFERINAKILRQTNATESITLLLTIVDEGSWSAFQISFRDSSTVFINASRASCRSHALFS